MELSVKFECDGIDWKLITDILKTVGMAYYTPEIHAKAFKASEVTVFVYDAEKLIGFGRAISDGAYQAAIYDCAVLPEYQGKKIGSIIIENILQKLESCNVILYAAPGKEGFYQKHGFSIMKTGMAKFINSDSMRNKGFIE